MPAPLFEKALLDSECFFARDMSTSLCKGSYIEGVLVETWAKGFLMFLSRHIKG